MAKKKKQYCVDAKKKVVVANVSKLTDSELQAVKNYVALGYKLEEGTIKPKTKGLYTRANIEKFIKDNKIDFNFKSYEEELNEEGKKKGFINAQKVFRSAYEKEFLEYMGK